MNKRKSVQLLLLPSVAVLLLASVLHHARREQNKSNFTISKSQEAPNPHAHFHEVLVKLAAAKLSLMHSVAYHDYYNEQKKEILAEIESCKKITRETAGIHVALVQPRDDMIFVNGAVKSLQAALDASSLIEEGILTSENKKELRDHIQSALDKMIQVQQAEQQSQPQKSNP